MPTSATIPKMCFVEPSNPDSHYKALIIEGDDRSYTVPRDQKWLPHYVPKCAHPFTEGERVGTTQWIRNNALNGATEVVVSKMRALRLYRSQKPILQVEIQGYPQRWFCAEHFTALAPKTTIWQRILNKLLNFRGFGSCTRTA